MPPRFPKEFRDDVIKVALNRDPDVTLAQIAKDFGESTSEHSISGYDRNVSRPVRSLV